MQCTRVAYPGWFWPYLDREAEAAFLRSWQPLVVDGLLQTEDYARAILRAARPRDSGEKIDQLVTARMDRQAILSRDDPPDLWVIVDESVLRRPAGEPGVMTGQLVERREDVRNVGMLYDTLRAEALSPRASEQLIAEVIGAWMSGGLSPVSCGAGEFWPALIKPGPAGPRRRRGAGSSGTRRGGGPRPGRRARPAR
ncbi:MAG: DUF5753 domain-containing protein [Streptosporangiaceae bacterium]